MHQKVLRDAHKNVKNTPPPQFLSYAENLQTLFNINFANTAHTNK